MAKAVNKSKNEKESQSNKSVKSEVTTAKDSASSEASSEKTSSAEGSSKDHKELKNTGSKGYVRGENQKPVTKAYRDNWNKIFKKN